MYNFKYVLSEDDYLEFNRFHFATSPAGKKALLLMRFMLPVLMVALYILVFLNLNDLTARLVGLVLFGLVAIAWVFLAKPLIMALMKIQVKKMKKNGKLPYGKEISIDFFEDCFVETTRESESKMNYSSIEKMACGDQAVYLYINQMQAFIIPLNLFESEQQKNMFCAFISSKIPLQAGL